MLDTLSPFSVITISLLIHLHFSTISHTFSSSLTYTFFLLPYIYLSSSLLFSLSLTHTIPKVVCYYPHSILTHLTLTPTTFINHFIIHINSPSHWSLRLAPQPTAFAIALPTSRKNNAGLPQTHPIYNTLTPTRQFPPKIIHHSHTHNGICTTIH